jgi:hypothetical protein
MRSQRRRATQITAALWFFAFGAFAGVVGAGAGAGVVLCDDERGEEECVLEAVVAVSRGRRVVDRFGGAPVDGGQAGIRSESAAVGEPGGVADLREGSCTGAGTEPRRASPGLVREDARGHRFDLFGQVGAGCVDPFKVGHEPADDLTPRVLAGQRDGLRGERLADRDDDFVGDPR